MGLFPDELLGAGVDSGLVGLLHALLKCFFRWGIAVVRTFFVQNRLALGTDLHQFMWFLFFNCTLTDVDHL